MVRGSERFIGPQCGKPPIDSLRQSEQVSERERALETLESLRVVLSARERDRVKGQLGFYILYIRACQNGNGFREKM